MGVGWRSAGSGRRAVLPKFLVDRRICRTPVALSRFATIVTMTAADALGILLAIVVGIGAFIGLCFALARISRFLDRTTGGDLLAWLGLAVKVALVLAALVPGVILIVHGVTTNSGAPILWGVGLCALAYVVFAFAKEA